MSEFRTTNERRHRPGLRMTAAAMLGLVVLPGCGVIKDGKTQSVETCADAVLSYRAKGSNTPVEDVAATQRQAAADVATLARRAKAAGNRIDFVPEQKGDMTSVSIISGDRVALRFSHPDHIGDDGFDVHLEKDGDTSSAISAGNLVCADTDGMLPTAAFIELEEAVVNTASLG